METEVYRRHPTTERFDPRARELVLEALGRAAPPRTHVSGPILARMVCAVARERFGITARLVLDRWGIRSTKDIGVLVFDMVAEGALGVSAEDSIDDFAEVVDLQDTLERDYPWGA